MAGELGFRRRDNPSEYAKAWRKLHPTKQNAYARRYYHEVTKSNPEALAAKLKSGAMARRKAKYGILRVEYENMVLTQNVRCLICGERNENLRVDHDHETKEIRGLLCPNCNAGLGMFKEDPKRLTAAKAYLERHTGGEV